MKTIKTIWNAIKFPFVTIAILWSESANLVFGEKEGGEER